VEITVSAENANQYQPHVASPGCAGENVLASDRPITRFTPVSAHDNVSLCLTDASIIFFFFCPTPGPADEALRHPVLTRAWPKVFIATFFAPAKAWIPGLCWNDVLVISASATTALGEPSRPEFAADLDRGLTADILRHSLAVGHNRFGSLGLLPPMLLELFGDGTAESRLCFRLHPSRMPVPIGITSLGHGAEVFFSRRKTLMHL